MVKACSGTRGQLVEGRFSVLSGGYGRVGNRESGLTVRCIAVSRDSGVEEEETGVVSLHSVLRSCCEQTATVRSLYLKARR